jgi:hypothetical protein
VKANRAEPDATIEIQPAPESTRSKSKAWHHADVDPEQNWSTVAAKRLFETDHTHVFRASY